MSARFLARHIALLSLVGSHLEDIRLQCPAIAGDPAPQDNEMAKSLHEQLKLEVQRSDEGEGAQVVFYGDSITEAWRGTDVGRSCNRCYLGPEVFQASFGSKYRTLIMAVGGDQATQVHWRIMNGNVPVNHQPEVAVVNAGINDLLLGNGCYPMDALGNITALRVIEMVSFLLRELPKSQILVTSILPAGNPDQPETLFRWPNALTVGIEMANSWQASPQGCLLLPSTSIRKLGYNMAQCHVALSSYFSLADVFQGHERVTFLDCNHKFVPFGWIEQILQADGLHPSHYGFKVLADCISPAVDDLMPHEHRQHLVRPSGSHEHYNYTQHHNYTRHVPSNQLPSFLRNKT